MPGVDDLRHYSEFETILEKRKRLYSLLDKEVNITIPAEVVRQLIEAGTEPAAINAFLLEVSQKEITASIVEALFEELFISATILISELKGKQQSDQQSLDKDIVQSVTELLAVFIKNLADLNQLSRKDLLLHLYSATIKTLKIVGVSDSNQIRSIFPLFRRRILTVGIVESKSLYIFDFVQANAFLTEVAGKVGGTADLKDLEANFEQSAGNQSDTNFV